jgi:NADH-quinone oxidoreductase subunit M
VVKLQTGSLAAYAFHHADRRGRAGQRLPVVPVTIMNAAGFPILSLVTWLPLVGCLVIMSVRGDEATVASNARWTALWTSLIVFVLSLVLWVKFDPTESGFQFVEDVKWLPEYGVGYKMGVDGISVLFVLLSTC